MMALHQSTQESYTCTISTIRLSQIEHNIRCYIQWSFVSESVGPLLFYTSNKTINIMTYQLVLKTPKKVLQKVVTFNSLKMIK